MTQEEYKNILQKYLPKSSVDEVFELIRTNNIHFIIKKDRATKLGDFRAGSPSGPFRITINGSLNQFSFLLTFLHELAHYQVFINNNFRQKPHGKKWQSAFKVLIIRFISHFPDDVKKALYKTMNNLSASSFTNIYLAKALRKYDEDKQTVVSDLNFNDCFSIQNGRKFKILEKKRKRYVCQCIESKQLFLFNPMCQVSPEQSN